MNVSAAAKPSSRNANLPAAAMAPACTAEEMKPSLELISSWAAMPLLAGDAKAKRWTDCTRPEISGGHNPANANWTAPAARNESVSPPPGPSPVSSSGTTAMNPALATRSATARAQSLAPSLCAVTMTTGARSERSGLTTKARIRFGPNGAATHSTWRGVVLRICRAVAAAGNLGLVS